VNQTSNPEPLFEISQPARVGAAAHPCLLLLHGRGSHEQDLMGLAPHLDPRLYLVSVRAPNAWMGGYRWVDQDDEARQKETFGDSLQRLTALLDELPTRFPVDPASRFLLGFSQGSMMSTALLLTAPEKIAGALLLSGLPPNTDQLNIQADAVRGKPAFVAHGTYDSLLPPARGRAVRDALLALDVEVDYHEYPMDHQIVYEELQDIQRWLDDRLG
jgi:phospholipase/carboxylesterase